MSAQSLVASSQYPIIETGSFSETTGTITFSKAFPTGTVPAVFLQNAEGGAYDQVVFQTGVISNTSFAYLKFDTVTGANITTAIDCNYLAILIPNTTPY